MEQKKMGICARCASHGDTKEVVIHETITTPAGQTFDLCLPCALDEYHQEFGMGEYAPVEDSFRETEGPTDEEFRVARIEFHFGSITETEFRTFEAAHNAALAEELNREFQHYRQYGVVFATDAGRVTINKFVPLALRAHGFAPLQGEGWYRGTDRKKVYPLSRDVPDDQWRWEAAEQRR